MSLQLHPHAALYPKLCVAPFHQASAPQAGAQVPHPAMECCCKADSNEVVEVVSRRCLGELLDVRPGPRGSKSQNMSV